MSRSRCGPRECIRVLITPQDGQPASAVASARTGRCPNAGDLSPREVVVGQVENGGGSIGAREVGSIKARSF
jgi:hypothetical protein